MYFFTKFKIIHILLYYLVFRIHAAIFLLVFDCILFFENFECWRGRNNLESNEFLFYNKLCIFFEC